MNYTITFYVPIEECDQVKQAMFFAGAGSLGDYDQCCWQILGRGQFRALKGSHPTIGQQEVLTKIEEYRVEMFCDELHLTQAISAMKKTHPYEEVAFHVNEHVDI